jgi:hypothetical protein
MYNTVSYKVARGLGWFSIGLGVAELLAPGAINRSLGMREYNTMVRGFGLREIAAGLGILTLKNPTPWVWARVAGDALDATALLLSLGPDNPRRGSAATALVSVLGVTLIDILTARSLEQHAEYRQQPRRDYSDRSGFRRAPEQMRGGGKRVAARGPAAKRA